MTSQVRNDESVALGEVLHKWRKHAPCFQEAVQQYNRITLTNDLVVHLEAVDRHFPGPSTGLCQQIM